MDELLLKGYWPVVRLLDVAAFFNLDTFLFGQKLTVIRPEKRRQRGKAPPTDFIGLTRDGVEIPTKDITGFVRHHFGCDTIRFERAIDGDKEVILLVRYDEYNPSCQRYTYVMDKTGRVEWKSIWRAKRSWR